MPEKVSLQIASTSDREVAMTAFKITMRLFLFVDRLLFWLLHLLLGFALLLAVWWFQITPAHAKAAVSALLGSNAAQALQAIGLTVPVAYLAAARWVWNRTAWPWLKRRVLRGC